MDIVFDKFKYPTEKKLKNFEKYVRRQEIARFLVRYELFKLIQDRKGSIVECGVYYGGGLMAWAKLSASLEPVAIHRKIIGFDTFEGFPIIDDKDLTAAHKNTDIKEGGFSTMIDVYEEMKVCIEEFDENRFLNQFPKVKLVKGDATKTIPEYLLEHKHTLVSLLFIDFDLYQPTKVALEHFLPRMSKGSIIAFDEVNNEFWHGETLALLESMNINNYELKKFSFDPNISYIIL